MTMTTGTDRDDKQKIAALEAKIKEKNKLVKSLTSHLEQAAEKLDRLHRKGTGKSVSVAGIPKELVEQQKTLTEDLNRIVEQWEAMQMDAAMGRIEMQITEIRDLITSGSGVSGGTTIQAIRELSAISIQSNDNQVSESIHALESQPAAGSYEAMKAGLLSGSESQPSAEPAPQITIPAATVPEEALQSESLSTETAPKEKEEANTYIEEEIQDVEPPESIDLEHAQPDQLKEAIESRDTYLGYLIRKLRAAELSPRFTRGWQELEQTGEAVKERLEQLEETLNDNLVRAEIELSLERARLGRESIRLEQLEVQIEKKMKRLGSSGESLEEDSQDEEAEELESPRGRSWLKMLGLGKDEDEE